MITDELARIKRAELAAALNAGEGLPATELATKLQAPNIQLDSNAGALLAGLTRLAGQ